MSIGLLNSEFTKQIRISLLNRNLNPTAEASAGGFGSANSNRGMPAEISLPTGDFIPLNQDTVSTLGYYLLKNMSLKNRYSPTEFQQVSIGENISNFNSLGTYESYNRTAVPQSFNLKQYILNSPSIVGYHDTPLGIIGANQLKFSLDINITQNTLKNTIGRVNTDIFNLINGGSFLIRDYQITEVPNTPLGFFANLAQKYSGIEIPFSYIPQGSFGFLDSVFNGKVDYSNCNLEDLDDSTRMGIIGTETRNDSLLRYTGRGTRIQLFNLLGINKYRPNYESQNGGDSGLNRIFGFLQEQGKNDKSAYTRLDQTRRSTGVLPVMREQNIADFKIGSNKGAFQKNDSRSVLQENGLPKITWTDKDIPGGFKKFMFSIENLAWIGYTDGLPTCEIGNGDLSSDDKRPGRIMWFPPYGLDFDENVSLSWEKTSFIGRGEPIFTYNNTIRTGSIRFKVVVDHPSIINKLRPSFDDSDFKKFFNGCKTHTGLDYVEYALLFLDKQLGEQSQETITSAKSKIINSTKEKFNKVFNTTTQPGGTDSFSVKIFYPNASSSVEIPYETGLNDMGSTQVDSNLGINTQNYLNNTDFSLNSTSIGYLSSETIGKLQKLDPSEIDNVEVTISISCTNTGGPSVNDKLFESRFKSASGWVNEQLLDSKYIIKRTIKRGNNITVPQGSSTDVASIDEKRNRYALIEFLVKKKELVSTITSTTVNTETFSETTQETIDQLLIKTYAPVYKECDYFYFLKKEDPFIFDKLREKIKYFHPGFHSTTPEGLNSRLTFLHQCTRQGPAMNDNGGRSNLSFGRPPFCILRIGDFFHTKMVIESLSISYDEGVLWDLNPEGIGVQPRLASVNMTVSYLGGQSLMTPIRELQNAIGFNFYANTETFQHIPLVVSQQVSNFSKPTSGIPFESAGKDVPTPNNTLDFIKNNFGIINSNVSNNSPFLDSIITPISPTNSVNLIENLNNA